MHRRAEEINEIANQWVRHRGLKLVFDHATREGSRSRFSRTPALISVIRGMSALVALRIKKVPSPCSRHRHPRRPRFGWTGFLSPLTDHCEFDILQSGPGW